ncbi:MAG: M20/M25/M40 family metallo-hydrolase, partial [Erysipelotrichaceae bacterium]|nr:M20/M25/M40 family metallo-hydrolase [Erysipelotrichaceae bacterium]
VMPNGCFMYSRIIRDFPIYSSNIGTVRTNENGIAITIFYRSSIDSQRQDMFGVINKLSKAYGFDIHPQNDMPGWNYDPHSKLRDQLAKEFKAFFNQEMTFTAAAGGLETSIFKGNDPELDIIIIAPTIKGYHTPNEKLDIATFEKTYAFLKHFLSTL